MRACGAFGHSALRRLPFPRSRSGGVLVCLHVVRVGTALFADFLFLDHLGRCQLFAPSPGVVFAACALIFSACVSIWPLLALLASCYVQL